MPLIDRIFIHLDNIKADRMEFGTSRKSNGICCFPKIEKLALCPTLVRLVFIQVFKKVGKSSIPGFVGVFFVFFVALFLISWNDYEMTTDVLQIPNKHE